MKNLFFVCTGNTCRSPMAEVIAKSICQNKQINIFSRGIYANGCPASFNAIETTFLNGLDLSNHKSKTITKQEIENATIILTMTKAHKQFLLNIAPLKNIYTLCEYVLNEDTDVFDPFGCDLDEYQNCFYQIKSIVTKIDFDKI